MDIRSINHWMHRVLSWTSLILLLWITSCTNGFSIRFPAETPKEAAIQSFNLDIRRRKTRIDWNTVKILQEQPVNENVVFVLLSFQEFRDNGQQLNCLYYYSAAQSNQRWTSTPGGGGCTSPGFLPPDGSLIEVGQAGHWSRDPKGLTFSSAEGWVFDDKISGIDITWDDDVKQHAEVINKTYLAVRLAVRQVKKIEALDSNGTIIYTYTR